MFSLLVQQVRAVLKDPKGVSALEYGALAVGVVLAVAAAAVTLGGKLTTLFGTIGSSL
jgi:Flp pilus assembly pilin Flp